MMLGDGSGTVGADVGDGDVGGGNDADGDGSGAGVPAAGDACEDNGCT